ncbi:MAG: LTA synthase family protein [Oscillospiraceae bacterium]|jgi:phosphoglycerol transferase MdoB-like AlkP superfamily enzyme|nr:LTA synthase family protein [Oscillospiraceae bacterium]
MKLNVGTAGLYISVFIFSLLMTGAAFLLSPIPFKTALKCIGKNPLILLLNFLPVFLLTLLAYAVFNRLWPSFALVSVLMTVLTLVNYFKTLVRQEPFMPSDLLVIREAMTFSGAAAYHVSVKMILTLVGIVAAVVFSVFIQTPKSGWIVRSGIAAAALLAVFLLNRFVYSDRALYFSFYCHGSTSKMTDIYESRGFLYSFWYNINGMRIDRPEGYTDGKARDILAAYDNAPAAEKIPLNVILVLEESFTELSDDAFFTFEQDPLENYKKIKEESYYGRLIVPNFGGGTASTEFDILTGLSSGFINNQSPSSFWYVRKEHEAIVSAFKNNRYDAVAIHPGFDWFYNRKNVYRHFRFDSFLSRSDFDLTHTKDKAGLIADYASFAKLRKLIGEQPAGTPLFSYLVTIQNHTPYNNRFVENASVFTQPEALLTPEEVDILSNYFIGVADGDRELKGLTDYLRGLDEPYLLVFFGDHLPSLGTAGRVYEKLGYSGLREYEAPYLIWSNDAAKEVFDLNAAVTRAGLKPGDTISANYLGPLILELLGLDADMPFYRFVNGQRRQYPILREESAENTLDFRTVQYYRMTE